MLYWWRSTTHIKSTHIKSLHTHFYLCKDVSGLWWARDIKQEIDFLHSLLVSIYFQAHICTTHFIEVSVVIPATFVSFIMYLLGNCLDRLSRAGRLSVS